MHFFLLLFHAEGYYREYLYIFDILAGGITDDFALIINAPVNDTAHYMTIIKNMSTYCTVLEIEAETHARNFFSLFSPIVFRYAYSIVRRSSLLVCKLAINTNM